jgi:NitT/TauT family transport system permease protein/sulfonate transport system permease protein
MSQSVIVNAPHEAQRRLRGAQWVSNLLVAAIFGLWWFYSKQVPVYVLPGPIEIASDVGALLVRPEIAVHTYTSLLRVVVSVLSASVLGGGTVILAHHVRILRPFVGDRVIPILNAFPSLGWVMLGVIWFGVSERSIVFVETAILLPFSMVNIWEGLQALDEEVVEMGRSFTRKPMRQIWLVTLPLLRPYIVASLRTSYGVGWKVALIAELFGASTGIGYLMNLSRQNFDTAETLACIVVVILLVFVVDRLIFQPLARRWIYDL